MQTQFTPNRRTPSRVTPTIKPGDKVRIFDSLHAAYHWHEVTEIITGHNSKFTASTHKHPCKFRLN